MDLIFSCSSGTSFLYRRPLLPRQLSSHISTPLLLSPPLITKSLGITHSYSSSSVPTHKVTVHDRQRGLVHEFLVPEDQYILHTAESQNISLPFACRHGCCTSCAVRVRSGQIRQPEALGISAELKSKGYALLCVGFPSTDLEVETQDEDEYVMARFYVDRLVFSIDSLMRNREASEVYWLQFGRYFARGPIEKDDYALELAMADE